MSIMRFWKIFLRLTICRVFLLRRLLWFQRMLLFMHWFITRRLSRRINFKQGRFFIIIFYNFINSSIYYIFIINISIFIVKIMTCFIWIYINWFILLCFYLDGEKNCFWFFNLILINYLIIKLYFKDSCYKIN